LQRPFTSQGLKELLTTYGNITDIWLNHIKTHAIVTFSSVEESMKARNNLFGFVWPPKGGKALTLEYLEEKESHELIEKSKNDKSLNRSQNEPVTGEFKNAVDAAPYRKKEGNLYIEYKDKRNSNQKKVKRISIRNRKTENDTYMDIEENNTNAASAKHGEAIIELDKLFRKTIAKPQIYYLPLTKEQVMARKKKT